MVTLFIAPSVAGLMVTVPDVVKLALVVALNVVKAPVLAVVAPTVVPLIAPPVIATLLAFWVAIVPRFWAVLEAATKAVVAILAELSPGACVTAAVPVGRDGVPVNICESILA
jgi:hypothetical protein